MIDFDSLSAGGKTRRLRALAYRALERYGVEGARLRLLKQSWNTIFRVDTPAERYVLRISRPGVRDELDLESELVWMDALSRETDIAVPCPLRAANGSLLSRVECPGVPQPRHVALFTWLGGRHALRAPSPRVIRLLGETLARLHNHADTFTPPTRFTLRRFDHLGSFAPRSYLRNERSHPLLTAERLELFTREATRIQAEFDRLYGRGISPRFLHCDLHLGNVKLQGDRLAVLDFDDSMWAYPIQDIGISLYYLLYLRDFPSAVRDDFRVGYSRVRPWPEEWAGQVNLMIEARALDLVDVLLDIDVPYIRDNLPQLIVGIEEQIRTLSAPISL